jgi:hypothetical protein
VKLLKKISECLQKDFIAKSKVYENIPESLNV